MSERNRLPDTDADSALPSARGLLQCLRLLAEEAAMLQLGATLNALRSAITVCAAECESGPVSIRGPAGAVLH